MMCTKLLYNLKCLIQIINCDSFVASVFDVDVINFYFRAHYIGYGDWEEGGVDEVINEYFIPNFPHCDDSINSILLF